MDDTSPEPAQTPTLSPHALALIQKFYDSGGWTEARRREMAPFFAAARARRAEREAAEQASAAPLSDLVE